MDFLTKIILAFALTSHLAALDHEKDVMGSDCKVIEPIRNFTFDLNGMRSDLAQVIKSDDQPETFYFNLCGPMKRKCNNQTASACMRDQSGKEVVLGVDEKLFWNEGSIRFTFTDGEKCNDKENYTTNVLLHCDYNSFSRNGKGAFHLSGSCEVNIVLPTNLACLPIPDNVKNAKCLVKSPSGQVFDFTDLKNSNHKAVGPEGKSFMIGICSPVLYSHEVACEAGTSVCQIDLKATNSSERYKNMGMQTQDFKFEKDQISLTLTSNEQCEKDKKFSSKIIFECDKLATYSYPTYHATIDCVHLFRWPTVLACEEKKSCKVSDFESGASFDFSSLSGVQYVAVNKNNTDENFVFSVCSEAKDPCMKNTGSCVIKNSNKQSTQAGVANDELKLNNKKNPYLLYENGAICKQAGKKFTTRIDFICADSEKDEVPVVVEDGCEIVIQFKTLLACKFIKNCVTKNSNDETIDLRPLIDFDGNYIATVNEKTLPKEANDSVQYLLNVCRPLNTKYSLNCNGASGACRTIIDKNGKHEEEMSLGHPDYSLSTSKDGEKHQVIMKYFDGVICPTDPTEHVVTKIVFSCDEKAGLGNPILQMIDNCEYDFDFPTNILCPEQTASVTTNTCSLENIKTSVSMDLKIFGSNGTYQVGDKLVNLCGGSDKIYTIVYAQSLVRIEFAQNNGKDKIDVEVQLKCGANNQTTSTIDDRILVMHESNLICPLLKITPKAPSSSDDPSKEGDDVNTKDESRTGLALGYVFLVIIVIVAFVAFYLVIRNPERREIIRNLIKFRSTSRVQYSRNMNDDDFILS